MSSLTENYNQKRDKARRENQDFYLQFQDILDGGPKNPAERGLAEFDFLYFCKRYGGEAFVLDWSPNHVKAGQLIESAALEGECFAFAMPRGSGKTTLSRWGLVWATLFGHSRYSVLIGQTARSSERLLDAIKSTLRHNDLLFEDFPELACFRHMQGDARKAMSQRFQGDPSNMRYTNEQIIFPSMGALDYCRCSDAIIDITSITGDIRGRQRELPDGSIVRPTFVIVDDPQDRESAKSLTACEQREATIKSDVKYLAGPGKATGVVIPCTVIFEDDLADRLLDKSRNPEWQGEKTAMMEAFPWDNLPEAEAAQVRKGWDEYNRIRQESFLAGTKGKEANDHYAQHQVFLDGAAVVSWPERYFADKGELSGIQHAMNLFLEDEASFFAEYQNCPQKSAGESVDIPKPEFIRSKVLPLERGVVPSDAQHLTAFVDVSQNILWWMVVAWWDGFTGHIVDYGAWPDQGKSYFLQGTAKKRIIPEARAALGVDLQYSAALKWALEGFDEAVLGRAWESESGGTRHIDRCLIDKNWIASTKPIEAFCRRSPRASILDGYRGKSVTNPDDAIISAGSKLRPGERRGFHWVSRSDSSGTRQVLADVSFWKGQVMQGLGTAPGDPGGVTLYRAKPYEHRMLSEHLTAEECVRKRVKDVEIEVWDCKSQRDNHLLDCLVGCAVGASMLGIKRNDVLIPVRKKSTKKKKRGGVSYL